MTHPNFNIGTLVDVRFDNEQGGEISRQFGVIVRFNKSKDYLIFVPTMAHFETDPNIWTVVKNTVGLP